MKHKHEDYKLSAVLYHIEHNNSYANTCEIFKCSERSFKRWLFRYQEEQKIKRHNRLPVAYKMKQEWVAFALKCLKDNEQITMEELSKSLEEKFKDFNISRKHLGDVIRDLNQTRKRTRKSHFPLERFKKPIELKTEMNKFFSVVNTYPLDKIISIDETSISYFMSEEYSRCQLGKRCILKTTDNKVFQKFTLIGAITSTGLIDYKFYEKGGMTTERLVEFLNDILKDKKDYLVVLDNAPVHRTLIVRASIEASGNKLIYSIPYTPRTNAIESWFSQFKHYMKLDRTLTIDEIKSSIVKALKKIKLENYLHIFQYAYRKEELKLPRNILSTLHRKPKNYKISNSKNTLK